MVMAHFWSPHNARVMPDAHVIGRSGAEPGRGRFMLIYLKLDGARIAEASFQTNGCPPCIAAGSLLARELVRFDVREAASRWGESAVVAALGGLPEHKRHCSALAAQALSHACAQAVRLFTPREAPLPGPASPSCVTMTEVSHGDDR